MITASLAAIPEREPVLHEVINSLAPQVDKICVWLNGWRHTPKAVMHPKVVVYGGADLGDAGKFGAQTEDGYHLTCDDDLWYAPNYAEHMIEAVERYRRLAVVSLHGRRFSAFPITSYYRGATDIFRCLGPLGKDHAVQFPGSGVMAYHTDTIRFAREDFPKAYPNMADIHVGIACEKAGVSVITAAHPEGIVKHLPIDMARTIHARSRMNDKLQTERVNGFFARNRAA